MDIPVRIEKELKRLGISDLRPCQRKAIDAGLFLGKNLLVCTPTASGKTLVAELSFLNVILNRKGKCVYVVPLKALASEKFKEFKKRYSALFRIALSIGDTDSPENHLVDYDLIICTAEKLDSLLRHHSPWISHVKVLVVDEIHLLNDPGRGPTLEIIITIMRRIIAELQIVGLSATIGNPKELAGWLEAEIVEDSWRPVELHKGILFDNKVEFY